MEHHHRPRPTILVMVTATQRRPRTSAPTDGSRTITLRDAQPRPEDDAAAGGGAGPSGEPNTTVGVLKLRGAQQRGRQRVSWGADVVDNEGCGKKKSKSPCLVHAHGHASRTPMLTGPMILRRAHDSLLYIP